MGPWGVGWATPTPDGPHCLVPMVCQTSVPDTISNGIIAKAQRRVRQANRCTECFQRGGGNHAARPGLTVPLSSGPPQPRQRVSASGPQVDDVCRNPIAGTWTAALHRMTPTRDDANCVPMPPSGSISMEDRSATTLRHRQPPYPARASPSQRTYRRRTISSFIV